MSIYSDCHSGLIQRGETLFPFNSFDVSVDWDGVLKYLLELEEWDGK